MRNIRRGGMKGKGKKKPSVGIEKRTKKVIRIRNRRKDEKTREGGKNGDGRMLKEEE